MRSCVLFTRPWNGQGAVTAAWFSHVEEELVLYVRLVGAAPAFLDPIGSVMIIAVLENGAMLVLCCAGDRSHKEAGMLNTPSLTLGFPVSMHDATLLACHGLVEMQVRSVFHNVHCEFRDPAARSELMENARLSLRDRPLRRLG